MLKVVNIVVNIYCSNTGLLNSEHIFLHTNNRPVHCIVLHCTQTYIETAQKEKLLCVVGLFSTDQAVYPLLSSMNEAWIEKAHA